MGVEWVHFSRSERHSTLTFMGHSVHPWLWRCYCIIGVFGFGAASSQLLTDIAKYTIGRLRPHFWEICDPDVDCSLPINQNVYIQNYNCRGTNAKRVKEVRLVFTYAVISNNLFENLLSSVIKLFTWAIYCE